MNPAAASIRRPRRVWPRRSARVAVAITVLVVVLSFLVGGLGQAGAEEDTVQATVAINPLTVEVAAVPDEVGVGERFTVSAGVSNAGPSVLRRVSATVDHDAEGLRRFGPEQRNLSTIRPHHDRDVAWRFRALEEGCYVIQVTVEAIHAGTHTVVEATGSTNIEVDACTEG